MQLPPTGTPMMLVMKSMQLSHFFVLQEFHKSIRGSYFLFCSHTAASFGGYKKLWSAERFLLQHFFVLKEFHKSGVLKMFVNTVTGCFFLRSWPFHGSCALHSSVWSWVVPFVLLARTVAASFGCYTNNMHRGTFYAAKFLCCKRVSQIWCTSDVCEYGQCWMLTVPRKLGVAL